MDCRELEFSGPDHDGWLVAPLLLFRSIARSFLRGLNGILAPGGEACVGDEAVARVRVAHGRDVQLVACRQLVVNEAPSRRLPINACQDGHCPDIVGPGSLLAMRLRFRTRLRVDDVLKPLPVQRFRSLSQLGATAENSNYERSSFGESEQYAPCAPI